MQIDLQRDRARGMRKSMTVAERRLWNALKSRQLAGFRFNRQVEIGPFIVDFLNRERMVIVEVDGATHGDSHEVKYDEKRTLYLEEHGYVVFRAGNIDVLTNLDGVLDGLLMVLEKCDARFRRSNG